MHFFGEWFSPRITTAVAYSLRSNMMPTGETWAACCRWFCWFWLADGIALHCCVPYEFQRFYTYCNRRHRFVPNCIWLLLLVSRRNLYSLPVDSNLFPTVCLSTFFFHFFETRNAFKFIRFPWTENCLRMCALSLILAVSFTFSPIGSRYARDMSRNWNMWVCVVSVLRVYFIFLSWHWGVCSEQ